MSSGSGADGASSGRVRTARNTSAENKAIHFMIAKGEKELAARRAERAEARQLRLLNLEEEREAEDKDEEVSEDFVVEPRKTEKMQEAVDPMLSPEMENMTLPEKVVCIEKKWRSTMETNDELIQQKITLSEEVDRMKDNVEDAEQALSELGYDREYDLRAMAEIQEQALEQHEELALLCADLVAKREYMEDLGIAWPPRRVANGNDGPETETDGESTCNHTSEEETEATTTEEDDEDYLRRRPSQHDIRERQKQMLLHQIGRLKQEIQQLQRELKERKSGVSTDDAANTVLMRDTTRLLNDYKSRLEVAEADHERLTSQVDLQETQVKRLKGLQEDSEVLEDELKLERRKLQREMRQAKNQAEELEVENDRLQKRIDQLRKRLQRDQQ